MNRCVTIRCRTYLTEDSKEAGFTLPELMISIAIVSVMVVIVWGVIGSAHLTMNEADRKATQARIAQTLIGELILNDWNSILSYDGAEHFFDAEGNRMPNTENLGKSDAFWVYRAVVEVGKDQAAVPGTESPNRSSGSRKGGKGSDPPIMTRMIVVRITNGPFPNYNFQQDRRHETFATWVSKMDKI